LSKTTLALKTLALGALFGLLSAQAIPVVFAGNINIQPSGPYFINFFVFEKAQQEAPVYSLYWSGGEATLTDSSGNFDFVTDNEGGNWAFQFTRDVLAETFSLDFYQFVEGQSLLSFELVPPDPSVTISQNSPTYLTIGPLDPTRSYSANIAATDPFSGSFTINAMAGGAPELDPCSAALPGLFVWAGLLATRRRRQTA